MKLISHRGNTNGKNPERENQPEYIDEAINLGYDAEVDVWYEGGELYLGHDLPQYKIDLEWLWKRHSRLWIHCKNIKVIEYFNNQSDTPLHYFWHEDDEVTLTSKGFIWAYPGNQPIKGSISVLPELNNDDVSQCYGVCSDFIVSYKNKKSFSVHHQTYNNRKAVESTLTEFRKYFPLENYRLISDNGEDFSDLEEKFNIDFVFKEKNTFPGGRFQTIQNCYDWLERVNETCELYDTEWIVLFEDDVLTQNSDIQFPTEDSGGMRPHPWSFQLTNLLKTKNTKNENWGYGMCGGSIFRRESFLNSYKKINEFDLEKLSQLDDRIIGYSDTLVNSFLQYFGYSYQKWDCLDDMTIPDHEYSKKSCFIHGNKLYY